jgi:RNA polymerase sigma-70 factor (ECF subfamily)
VSSTLSGELGWNSTPIDGDPVAYVAKLQESDGGDISVAGGIETIRSLFAAGAIDVLTLTVHPVVTNEGRRLFDDTVSQTRLDLVGSTITSMGNAVLSYSLHH